MNMHKKLNTKNGGFTLVEIMIVVAIIALLASVAVPSFLRARKRSQATATLKLLQQVDSAKDLFAIDNNKPIGYNPSCAELLPYAKVGTELYKDLAVNHVADMYRRDIAVNSIDQPPQITNATMNGFSDVTTPSFWGPYSVSY